MAHSAPTTHPAATDVVDHSSHPTSHAHDDGHIHVHVVPMKLLTGIFAILIALTVLTYAVTLIDLGYTGNLIMAIAIAVVKGMLVALYFMHLRWDNLFNSLSLLSAILFVGLFIVIASLDTGQYQHLRDEFLKMSSK